MDRRGGKRVAPKDRCAVTLVLPAASLNGIAWNLSPTGAELVLESDRVNLADLLYAGTLLQLCVNDIDQPVSLVWFGKGRTNETDHGDERLTLGVEFRSPSLLRDFMSDRNPDALWLSNVRHRSIGELRVATALRDLFLAVGSGEFSLNSALDLLCQKLRDLTGAEVVDFWALEEGRAILRAQAGRAQVRLGWILPPDRGSLAERFPVFKTRIQNGEQLFSNDLVHSRLSRHPWVQRHGIQSAMIIPVFGRKVDLGILAFGHTQNPFAFGSRQQAEAEIFASQAALFFEKAAMLRDMQDSASFLAAMNRIALVFHQRLAVRQVLEVVCGASRELFEVDIATVFLRDDAGFVQEAACGMRSRDHRIQKLEVHLRELDLVNQGEAFFINDFTTHPFFQLDIVRRHFSRRPAQSIMVIPIRENDKLLGVLALGDLNNSERFTVRDVDKGKLLAEQAAQAIVNARLYERVDQSKRIIRQQDRFRILGELAGVVAHEIKNALVPLRTLVDLLPERYNDADFREWYGKTVRQEVERMHGLVMQLARFRSPESRTVEAADPAALLRGVVELLQPEALGRQIQLQLETEPDLPVIPVVANEIRQVLLNLILNAIQAIEEKGIVRVGVQRVSAGKGALFWVSDTGPGIAPDKVEKIFDPLYTTKANGSGLGLAVARDLVEGHGGTIRVESIPGQGAAFFVLLPEEAPTVDGPMVIH